MCTVAQKLTFHRVRLYRDYQGQRYWFCCAACGPLFDANPDQYANAA